ncbi:MAG: (2Fe-2S)-binding protein [Blautia sp.]|nr:(2Fe-2S)-binding protein [Blautia sp.]
MGNRLICGCERVYEKDIVEAVRQGARTLSEVQSRVSCATSCGNCKILIEKVIQNTLQEMQAS